MNDIFLGLTFPFVYLDSSFLYRTNNIMLQKLTRRLLSDNPKKFNALLNKLIIDSAADRQYYEQIIRLQQENIISTVVTYEALNSEFVTNSPNLISLFGNIAHVLAVKDLLFSHSNEDFVLWNENIGIKNYTAAAMAILNSPCIVADSAFLSLSVGRSLSQYIKSDSRFYVLKYGNVPQEFGDNSIVCELSPKKFIQILQSQL